MAHFIQETTHLLLSLNLSDFQVRNKYLITVFRINGNDGTITGATWKKNTFNGGYHLDYNGTSNKVTISDSTDLSFTDGAGNDLPFTIAFWMKNVSNPTTGYALSKKKFTAKKTLFSINQMALMFVPIAVAIPRYLVIDSIGLNDNFLVHIVPYLAMPVGLFLIKQFIDQVPDELIEAAKIDGANDFHILFKIIIPLVTPALATISILTFQLIWNSTESSNIYIITIRRCESRCRLKPKQGEFRILIAINSENISSQVIFS